MICSQHTSNGFEWKMHKKYPKIYNTTREKMVNLEAARSRHPFNGFWWNYSQKMRKSMENLTASWPNPSVCMLNLSLPIFIIFRASGHLKNGFWSVLTPPWLPGVILGWPWTLSGNFFFYHFWSNFYPKFSLYANFLSFLRSQIWSTFQAGTHSKPLFLMTWTSLDLPRLTLIKFGEPHFFIIFIIFDP